MWYMELNQAVVFWVNIDNYSSIKADQISSLTKQWSGWFVSENTKKLNLTDLNFMTMRKMKFYTWNVLTIKILD